MHPVRARACNVAFMTVETSPRARYMACFEAIRPRIDRIVIGRIVKLLKIHRRVRERNLDLFVSTYVCSRYNVADLIEASKC